MRTSMELETDIAAYERELTGIFIEIAEALGMPASLGAIYGLLFASPAALTMEEVIAKLEISKGSASQGLRHLEEFGAVIRERADCERSHRYSASLELKNLFSGFLRERLVPRLQRGQTRLSSLEDKIASLSGKTREIAKTRVAKLTRWHQRATLLLPLVQKFVLRD